MPSVAENVRRWSNHAWDHEGHRWSPGGTPAGTRMMWWRSIRPRIHPFLPSGTVLEIAPGFGRWTAELLPECLRLIGVDVTERCVDVCRARFTDRAEFWVNDGQSLPMVEGNSIDFAFSLDSLVHAEATQVRSYVDELARVLKPAAVAFLHHSNLGAYAGPTGRIPTYVRERYWRGASVSARFVRDACSEAGLICLTQELINWVGRDSDVERHRLAGVRVPLTDCFSVCARPPAATSRPLTRVYINRDFVEEWRQIVELAHVYASLDPANAPGPVPPAAAGGKRRLRIPRGIRPRIAGRVFEHREGVARAVQQQRCPDCGRQLSRRDGLDVCEACRTSLVVR